MNSYLCQHFILLLLSFQIFLRDYFRGVILTLSPRRRPRVVVVAAVSVTVSTRVVVRRGIFQIFHGIHDRKPAFPE